MKKKQKSELPQVFASFVEEQNFVCEGPEFEAYDLTCSNTTPKAISKQITNCDVVDVDVYNGLRFEDLINLGPNQTTCRC